jgi:hypothetical protein
MQVLSLLMFRRWHCHSGARGAKHMYPSLCGPSKGRGSSLGSSCRPGAKPGSLMCAAFAHIEVVKRREQVEGASGIPDRRVWNLSSGGQSLV